MIYRNLESNRKAQPKTKSKKTNLQQRQEKAAKKMQLHNLENELLELIPKLASEQ